MILDAATFRSLSDIAVRALPGADAVVSIRTGLSIQVS